MARPKSNNKRNDILTASYRVIARDGLDVSTATIAKEAGIATGSLFTYFPTKAALYNELYTHLKTEMVTVANSNNHNGSDHDQLHDNWTSWMDWAMADADKQRALDLLRVSDLLTLETQTFSLQIMQPTFDLIRRCGRSDLDQTTLLFINTAIGAIADTTMNLMSSDPTNAGRYREEGFEAIWKIIS